MAGFYASAGPLDRSLARGPTGYTTRGQHQRTHTKRVFGDALGVGRRDMAKRSRPYDSNVNA